MRKIFVVLLAIASFYSCSTDAQNASLDSKAFESAMNSGTYQLLDVRTAGEYQSGHLKNSLQADWNNQDQFVDRIKYLDKSKPLLVYCASGVRSGNAAKYLTSAGFKTALNLEGGLNKWKYEGRAVESAGNVSQLTLDAYTISTKQSATVLVDFGAQWCPPCKKMEPILKDVQADKSLQFSLVKVDGGNDIDVMKANQVSALPVFIIYKNGKEVWRKQGVVEAQEFKKLLSN
jgi:rhodanese-related sulfurtransferase/glutaredoxin